jgi:phosphatidate cytidylyltransferase
MTRRILAAAILIPVVIASLFFFPLYAFLILLDLFLFFALKEFSNLAEILGSKISSPTYVLSLMSPWVLNYQPAWAAALAFSAILLSFIWCLFTTLPLKETFSRVGTNLFALAYLAVPFSLISTFHHASFQSEEELRRPFGLLFVLVIVWLSDAAALSVGKAVGKNKVTPNISPNKTLEGYLAAILLPVVAAYSLGHYLLPGSSRLFLVVTSMVIASTGTLGDLFESVLKRGAGIKDTSNLIPGHGGILDRVDSLLFAVPAYYLLTTLLS